MAKVKNDRKSYVKREVCAPKDTGTVKGAGRRGEGGTSFFTAPVFAGRYLDLRPAKNAADKR